MLPAGVEAHAAAHARGARKPRVRERRQRRVGGPVGSRPPGGRVVLVRARRLARDRARLELRRGRRMRPRNAPVALVAPRPRAPSTHHLHARLLAPPAIQLRAARLRYPDLRLLGAPRKGSRRRRPRRARPRLRALCPGRGHPLVRRGNRWPQPARLRNGGTRERRAAVALVRGAPPDAPSTRLQLALPHGVRARIRGCGLRELPLDQFHIELPVTGAAPGRASA